MNAKRTVTILFIVLMALAVMTVAASASGGGTMAIFSGRVLDGQNGPGVAADVHLSCDDGTAITVRSDADGWYTIMTDDNPAAWCSLWATGDDGISSGIYGYNKTAWTRQDLTLMWYFNFSPQKDMTDDQK